jgi:hypothetical protein
MNGAKVTKEISIEELVNRFPGAVGFLIRRNIPCLVCGEPLWGTLEEAARENGKSADEIERLVVDLNVDLEKQ